MNFDNYTIEYGPPSAGGKMISAIYVHDKSEHKAVTIPVWLNEGGQFGERKYFVGTLEKKWSAPPDPVTQGWSITWGFKPVDQLMRNEEITYIYNRDLDLLKQDLEVELRDAGILAMGGGAKYDPKTGVGVKRKPKKPRTKKKSIPCTNTFIDGSVCTRPVAKQFVDREATFHLCSECAEELGIS